MNNSLRRRSMRPLFLLHEGWRTVRYREICVRLKAFKDRSFHNAMPISVNWKKAMKRFLDGSASYPGYVLVRRYLPHQEGDGRVERSARMWAILSVFTTMACALLAFLAPLLLTKSAQPDGPSRASFHVLSSLPSSLCNVGFPISSSPLQQMELWRHS